MTDGTQDQWPKLTPADQAAVDAVVDGGGSTEDVRAQRVESILGLAGSGPALSVAERDRLIERVMARLQALAWTPAEARLIPDDEEALDAWVLAGYRSHRVPGSLRERAEKLEGMAALVAEGPAVVAGAARSGLIESTLARLDVARESIPIERAVVGKRARWADVVSVAAMLALGSAVLWPVVGNARSASQQTACLSGLRAVGQAIASYAEASKGSLPLATASVGGLPWWEVGRPEHSNSANLFTLARESFVGLPALACAARRRCELSDCGAGARDWKRLDDVTYSYRVMFGSARPRLGDPVDTVVVSDASPVVRRAVRGEVIFPTENSGNHDGHGQNVLRLDGSGRWMATPITEGGDNIWLPRSLEDTLRRIAGRLPAGSSALVRVQGWEGPRKVDPIRGNEVPADAGDAFVGP